LDFEVDFMKIILAITSVILFMAAELYAGSGIFMFSANSFLISKPDKVYGHILVKNLQYKTAIKKKSHGKSENAKIKGKLLLNGEEIIKKLNNKISNIFSMMKNETENTVTGIIDKNNRMFKEKINITIRKSRN
jgi:hypothetical protein